MITLSELPDKIMETKAPDNATTAEILLWEALSQMIINHCNRATSLLAFNEMETYLDLKKIDKENGNDPS